MADTPATVFSDIMTNLINSATGGIEVRTPVNLMNGKVRHQISRITLASQTAGTVMWVARLPLYSVLLDVDVMTDTSLGSTTLAFGDAHNGNSAIYGAAATLTALNTKTRFGPPVAAFGLQINTGYDYNGVLVSPFMPQTPGFGGAMFEDVIMTFAAATAPASGNLVVDFKYAID